MHRQGSKPHEGVIEPTNSWPNQDIIDGRQPCESAEGFKHPVYCRQQNPVLKSPDSIESTKTPHVMNEVKVRTVVLVPNSV